MSFEEGDDFEHEYLGPTDDDDQYEDEEDDDAYDRIVKANEEG